MSAPVPASRTAPPASRTANPARTARGERTRAAILDAAEDVFAELGYTEASIVKITERAGVAQGTFYLYFASKLEVFEELVADLNRRVRHAMTEASAAATTRLERERAGFRGFFEFTARHPALYRVVREAESVSPRALRSHYENIVSGYIDGLRIARASGEVGEIDPAVAAWMLMGIGEMVGMRWVLWGTEVAGAGSDADPLASGTSRVPDQVFDEMMRFIERGLDVRDAPAAGDGAPAGSASADPAPARHTSAGDAPARHTEQPADPAPARHAEQPAGDAPARHTEEEER